jgi:cholesterol oxidase
MLDVRPVPADPRTGQLPPKTRLMAQAARLLGQSDGFFHPNLAVRFEDQGPNQFGVAQGACTFSGQCDIGCNEGAKNTLDLNYLALAERHGAAVGTLTEAVHIARAGDGYQVRLREHGHPGADREGVERDVTAGHVFVCAGAIGTTELLLRSRDQYRTLPDLPPSLGHGYSGNGDFLSFGDGLRELAEPSNGPTITTAALLHTGTEAEEQWFVLEEGGYSEHLAKLVRTLHVARLPAYAARLVGTSTRRVLGTARDLGATLDDGAARTTVLLAMGGDRSDGRIELHGPRHRLHVTWDVTRNDPLYEAERAVSGQVVRALGGRPFGTPTWRLFRQPVTVHNLGGARMGSDPETGVVDTDGEVFGHPGLFVLDGAVLPGATGANPSSTIAAVAERCIEVAVRRITGNRDWVAPERAQVVPRDLPEDRAVRAVVGRGGPRADGSRPGLPRDLARQRRRPGRRGRRGRSGAARAGRAAPRGGGAGSPHLPRRPRPRRPAQRNGRGRGTDAAAGGRRPGIAAPAGARLRRSPANHGLHRALRGRQRGGLAAPGLQAGLPPRADRPLAGHDQAGRGRHGARQPLRRLGSHRHRDHRRRGRGAPAAQPPADRNGRCGRGRGHAATLRRLLLRPGSARLPPPRTGRLRSCAR